MRERQGATTSVSVIDGWCRRGIEFVLLVLAVGLPWALGGMLPGADLALRTGVGVALLLWATRIAFTRTLHFRADPVLAALGGLSLLTAVQLTPLPRPVLGFLSPAAVEANDFLRPSIRERLPDESGPEVSRPAALPASLSPPDTREFFAQAFALTLLYATARSNFAGPGPLGRLAWACAVNGALLAGLAVAQRVSSPPTVIYWSIEAGNFVAGPFVNRNHLPFYLNVCLGLGAALLSGRFRGGAGEVLNRPSALWLVVLVGTTGAGLAVSQSRGGALAAAAATAGCVAVWLRRPSTARARPGGLGWAVAAAVAAAAAGGAVGWAGLFDRLRALDERPGADAGRFELWAAGIELFARFPLLGTGNGTFTWMEPSRRGRPGGEHLSAEYAHNEYVEALAEGGVIRFALTVLLAAAPVTALVRRHRRVTQRRDSRLLLGALFGVLALATHSVVDFGAHLPAVAVLSATLVAAALAADPRRQPAPSRSPVLATGVAGGLAAAATLLAWDGLTADRAERTRAATAALAAGAPLSPAEADRAVRHMAAAAAARPGNALYRHELGQALLARALSRSADSPDRGIDLRAALAAWRAARDLSPVMAPTQARLGRYRDGFAHAEPALVYFRRARWLLPTDSTMIYHCGRARWEAGDVAGACADWRDSLARADRHLGDILALAAPRLGPDGVLRHVLPDHPATIWRAAQALFPAGGPADAGYAAYLDRAIALLADWPTKGAADWALQGELLLARGRPAEGAAAFRRAVALAPRRIDWRLAYTRALHEAGQLEDARRELETVLGLEPGHRGARDELDVVRREIRLRPPP